MEKETKEVKKVSKKGSNKVSKEKKEEKYKEIPISKFKKIELIISSVVGVIFLALLVSAIMNNVFIPAALISFALFLFCICYYYLEDEKKKTLVYTLFGLGVLLIVIEVVYTLVKLY